MKRILFAVLTAAAVVSLGTGIFAPPASAASAATPPVSPSEAAQTVTLLTDLEASATPRTAIVVAGELQETFHFPNGQRTVDVTFVVPPAPRPGVANDLSGGWDRNGPYILLNSFDQDAVLSGGGALIGFLMCQAAPASCAGVTIIVTVVTLYLSYNGKCSRGRQLYVPVVAAEAGWKPLVRSLMHCVG